MSKMIEIVATSGDGIKRFSTRKARVIIRTPDEDIQCLSATHAAQLLSRVVGRSVSKASIYNQANWLRQALIQHHITLEFPTSHRLPFPQAPDPYILGPPNSTGGYVLVA